MIGIAGYGVGAHGEEPKRLRPNGCLGIYNLPKLPQRVSSSVEKQWFNGSFWVGSIHKFSEIGPHVQCTFAPHEKNMELNALTAISPIDGRYRKQTEILSGYFSFILLYRILN